MGLAEQLAEIETHVKAKLPGVAATLQAPAKKPARDKLAKVFAGTLPAELATWFLWHDGQRDDASAALVPETNWTAMSCASCVATHAFLSAPEADIQQPYKATWVPLFANGGGDHLCWDRDSGAIVTWYHDDAVRPIAYKSFAILVDKLAKAYAKLKAPKGFAGPAIRAWTPMTRAPSEAQLNKLPVGATFVYDAKLPMGRRTIICVKLAEDRWLEVLGTGLKDALARWTELAAKPPPDSSGYYHRTWNTWYEMKKYQATLRRGS